MPVLHQVIAVEKGTKNRVVAAITEIHKTNQKPDLFAGINRSYTPGADDGEKLPAENTLVQRNAVLVFRQVTKLLSELFSITAQRDFTNCVAKADIEIDGVVLAKDVPATHLLFLEKQLIDVRTLISMVPTLDAAYLWTRDENSELYRSNTIESTRTKKVEEFVVVLQPTKEHPGKHEKVTRDLPVGTWHTTKLSGALPIPRKEELMERVEKLIKAVKYAREKANIVEVVQPPPIADAIFGYLFK